MFRNFGKSRNHQKARLVFVEHISWPFFIVFHILRILQKKQCGNGFEIDRMAES